MSIRVQFIARPWRGARRLWAARRGAMTVEVAVAMPALILLGLGAVNQGAAMIRNMEIANAVRSGTQYALVRKPVAGDLTQIRNAVDNTAPADFTGTQSITVNFFCECPDGTPVSCTTTCGGGDERRSFVEVTMSENYPKPIQFFAYGGIAQLQQRSTVRLN